MSSVPTFVPNASINEAQFSYLARILNPKTFPNLMSESTSRNLFWAQEKQSLLAMQAHRQ
jgi:hypothetical protein